MIDRFDILNIEADRSENPLQLFWAGSSSVTELYVFSHLSEWRFFIDSLSLNCQVPQIIDSKYERARYLYYLAWIYPEIIKAGEVAALAALELALKDSYPHVYQKIGKKGKVIRAYLKDGFKYMVEGDGLTDEKLPIFQKYRWPVISNLYCKESEDQTGTLVGIRNSLAHGDPFDAMPYAGLLEIVRDLIGYMYRNFQNPHN